MADRKRSVTEPLARSELAAFLAHYRSYLAAERGLVEVTIDGYCQTARWFLEQRCGGDPGRIGQLGPKDVSGYVVSERDRGLSPRTVNEAVVKVRALLRYCYAQQLIESPLAQAAPWTARSRARSLPRRLEPGIPGRLVASCDPEARSGLRDRAILVAFSRLGLRVSEMAALSLDDVDWRRGEVVVRGKSGWSESLPIPDDVGDALGTYLVARGRVTTTRRLYVTVTTPARPMSPTAVRAVVRRACDRVGIADCGTHWFRHSVAADLLAGGASLPEVGQLLRHHHLQTTAIYASVDRGALGPLAQPWPGASR